MELLSLYASSVATIPYSFSSPKFLIGKRSIDGEFRKLPSLRKNQCTGRRRFLGFRSQATGSLQGREETVETAKVEILSKDRDLVFVAGATGRVGSRTVRELLKLGFRVRAGVRDTKKAETLVQSVQRMKLDDGAQLAAKLDIVECDLEDPDLIGPAIRNASVVICCIGASEKEVFDITGPYRIDYKAAKNLIDAATFAKVNHFIMVTSLGTNKIGFPAAILNLFWGVLIWKRKAEESLISSGIPYTIVRPGGMERPTDAYKETHNLLLAKEDTLFGGQVSNLQVAELMAFMARNPGLSCCKVVEVIAETTAPLTTMEELLAKIPSHYADVTSGKESQAIAKPDPVPPEGIAPKVSSPSVMKEPTRTQVQTTRPLSPYIVYDDFKPPSSPSPNVPHVSLPSMSTTDGRPQTSSTMDMVKAQPSSADEPGDKEHISKPKPRPLSPFTMYEDLKPPTSPIPSPRKL